MRRQKRPAPLAVHAAVLLIVALWTLPTLGLFVTSFRDREAIAVSGWWTALKPSVRQGMVRTEGRAEPRGTEWVLEGSVFGPEAAAGEVVSFGIDSMKPMACAQNLPVDLHDRRRLVVRGDGSYSLTADRPFDSDPGLRIFYAARTPPALTLQNYRTVLGAEGLARAFWNSVLVAVPSTLLPTLIAAVSAYALAWMRFPGRGLLVAAVVGLMAVPLQMALIPLLSLYNNVGQAFNFYPKTYLGVWLAHTGFGLPLAIHVLRSSMATLPRELVESARLDGLSEARILAVIVLPLSLPALAAFAVFQFLWTWNDLLVALVFLGPQDDKLVLTGRLLNLMGSRGGEWEILAAAAFVAMALPVAVFFGLQRFLVRGLLAGALR